MSGPYLNALTENASRLGMRLQETFSERTRDLSISRGSASTYLEASDEKVKNLAKQLDSTSDREKLDAMKRLVAVRNPVIPVPLLVHASSDPAHLQRPQCLRVLCPSSQECCLTKL